MTEAIRDGLEQPRRNWAVVAIALGISVAVLDGAIANVALPTIAADLDIRPASSIWVVNAFQLAVTISLLVFSSLGDLWGYKKVYVGGLLLFSVTSLICALADSFTTLVIARGLQGIGASAIMSVNTALLRAIYPKHLLPKGMGLNALMVSVAAAAGPTVAAGILSVANWPWLFAVNIPIGLAAFGLSLRFLPANPVKVVGQHFDGWSAFLNAVAFGLLILVIDGSAHDLHWYILLSGFTVMSVVGYFFVRRQLHRPYPLFPVDLLRNRTFSLSVSASILSFVAQMLALVSIPFFFQRVLHLDEVETGLLLTPWPLATMIAAPLAARLMKRVNPGLLGAIGLLLFAASLLFLATMPSHPAYGDIIWRMALGGIGFGTFITPNNSLIIASSPPERSGGASGMLGMARLLGQTVGAAFTAVMFAFFPGHSMHVALLLGAGFAVVAALVSGLRLFFPKTGIGRN